MSAITPKANIDRGRRNLADIFDGEINSVPASTF